jgi:hypothetical protein
MAVVGLTEKGLPLVLELLLVVDKTVAVDGDFPAQIPR